MPRRTSLTDTLLYYIIIYISRYNCEKRECFFFVLWRQRKMRVFNQVKKCTLLFYYITRKNPHSKYCSFRFYGIYIFMNFYPEINFMVIFYYFRIVTLKKSLFIMIKIRLFFVIILYFGKHRIIFLKISQYIKLTMEN